MSKPKEAGLIVVFIFIILVMLVVIAAKAASPSDDADAYDSPPHKALDRLAEGYAQQMARNQFQDGHGGWFEGRYQKALQVTGCDSAQEITAESWVGQPNLSWEDQWEEFAESWRQSKGHWRIASRKHKWIGSGSACSRNGTWYGCLIVVD